MLRLTPAFTTAVALTLAACTSVPHNNSALSLDRGVGGLRTFTILPAPRHVGGTEGSSNPMADNSGANRALRDALREAFMRRGYAVADSSTTRGRVLCDRQGQARHHPLGLRLPVVAALVARLGSAGAGGPDGGDRVHAGDRG